MVELQAPGMQKHAFEGHRLIGAGEQLVAIKVTIFVVTGNRHTFGRQVNPNLVRATRFDGHFQQAKPPIPGCRKQRRTNWPRCP